MRIIVGLLKGLVFLMVMTVLFNNAGYAQSARTFGKKAITVRLCPATCVAVNGHGFKAGGKTTVLETKSGWARVSGYLERAKLVASFGDKTPAKPALWVPLSSLVSEKAKAKKVEKKKVVKKRVSVVDRLARLRKVPRPAFRPGGNFGTQTVAETTPVPATPVVVETPKVVEQPKPVEQKVEVVETQPVTTKQPEAVSSTGALTWEQVQAKLKAQKAGLQAAKPAAVVKPSKPVVDTSKALEAQKAAQAKAEEAARKVALERAAKISREADAARAAEAKRLADEQAAAAKKAADEKAAADLAKAAEAKKAADNAAKATEAKKAADDAAKAAEAKKLAGSAAKEAEAKRAADEKANIAARNAAIRKAAEAKRAADAKKAVEVAAAAEKAKKPLYSPPKEDGAAATNTEVAVVLPPKAPDATTKVEAPEPTFKSANTEPISFGVRPKKYTKALFDKRLRKLPGRKSGFKKEVVIALRHYGLGLLKSGECKGIAKGGPSAVPGMLYVACTDDPTYLRQFPFEEESW